MFVVRERVMFQKICALKRENLHGRDKNYSKEDGISINNSRFHFDNCFLPNTRIVLNFLWLNWNEKYWSIPFLQKHEKQNKVQTASCVGGLLVIVIFINFIFYLQMKINYYVWKYIYLLVFGQTHLVWRNKYSKYVNIWKSLEYCIGLFYKTATCFVRTPCTERALNYPW